MTSHFNTVFSYIRYKKARFEKRLKVDQILYHYFFQNLIEGFKPKIKRMQNLAAPKTIHISESGVGLLTHNTSEYEMGRLHRPESFVTPSNEAQ